MSRILVCATLCLLWSMLPFSSLSQIILKENLTKQHTDYWDFNKVKPQATGKYYKDQMGETTEQHGKWIYYDREGEIEEERNYYRGLLYGLVVRYFPNGKKQQEGYFKWDVQDSIYSEWYETGELMVKGEYALGKPVGRWEYYYRDGRLKSVEEVIDSVDYVWEFYLPDPAHTQTIVNGNGELTSYYTTGSVKEWYNFKNGLRDGEFEEISVYGYTTLKGSFQDGKKHGEWQYYYYTGDLEKVSHYNLDVLEGDYKYYYDNGKVNVEGRYENGQKDGEWTWYTNKGTRDMQGTFKEDKQHGDWTYWYPTGELSYYAKYKEGKQSGIWTYFYKNGKKFKEGTFEDDLKNGNWKTWYEDETLLMEGDYVNGKEEGEWKNYWESGDLKNKADFKSGHLDGAWESYYPNGKLHLTGSYKEDMKVGEWIEYFDNGKPKDLMTYKLFKKKSLVDYGPTKDRVIMESKLHGHSISYSAKDFKITEEGDYKEGQKDGEWIAYHPGGRVPAVVSNYKDGQLNGTMKTYDRRGDLLQEADYQDGVKHGRFIVYDKRGNVLKEMKFEYGMQVIEGSNNGHGTFTPGK